MVRRTPVDHLVDDCLSALLFSLLTQPSWPHLFLRAQARTVHKCLSGCLKVTEKTRPCRTSSNHDVFTQSAHGGPWTMPWNVSSSVLARSCLASGVDMEVPVKCSSWLALWKRGAQEWDPVASWTVMRRCSRWTLWTSAGWWEHIMCFQV